MDTLSVNATLDNLPEIMDFVRDFSLSHSANSEQLMAIELAVEETAVNVINYAYPAEQSGKIQISCNINKQQELVVIITDDGLAYNPLTRAEPDINASIDDRGIGGLGVFLTKQMMDDVIYERKEDNNILTLIKSLNKND